MPISFNISTSVVHNNRRFPVEYMNTNPVTRKLRSCKLTDTTSKSGSCDHLALWDALIQFGQEPLAIFIEPTWLGQVSKHPRNRGQNTITIFHQGFELSFPFFFFLFHHYRWWQKSHHLCLIGFSFVFVASFPFFVPSALCSLYVPEIGRWKKMKTTQLYALSWSSVSMRGKSVWRWLRLGRVCGKGVSLWFLRNRVLPLCVLSCM